MNGSYLGDHDPRLRDTQSMRSHLTALLLLTTCTTAQPASVLLVSRETDYVARALRELDVPHERIGIGEFVRGERNPFDYEAIVFGGSRSRIERLAPSLRMFVELGGIIVGFRHDVVDPWLPSPMSRDRAYQLGKILKPRHPVFNAPHKFDEPRLNKVHSGSIYRGFYDLGEGWTPLLSAGKQQHWDKQDALSDGPHYGIVEGQFGKGRIVLVQMIPAYAWFHDEKGKRGCVGELFFENLIRYARSITTKRPGPRKPRSKPPEYSDTLEELLAVPKGSGGLPLADAEWKFSKRGPFTGENDRRGVFTIGHPDAPSEAGNYGQLARVIRVPKDAKRCQLRVYQSDDYCGGYEPKMVGDRRVSRTLNRREGYRFRQVLVDGKVIHEEDVLGRNPLPAAKRVQWFDVTELAKGKDAVEVALRVEDRKGTDDAPFATDVFWAAVDLRPDLARMPAQALAGSDGTLKWRVAGLPSGDYVVAVRLRDDPYGQSSLEVAINGRSLAQVTLSADDARHYWFRTPPTHLKEGATIVVRAQRDGQESVVLSELAVVPSALVRDTPLRPATQKTRRAVSVSKYYRPVAPAKHEIVDLLIKEPCGIARRAALASQAVPFAFGALPSAQHIAVRAKDGRELPIQVRPVTQWPDGSVQTAVVSLPAQVPANGEAKYELHFGSEVVPKARPELGLKLVEDETNVHIDTGPLRLTVPRKSGDIFSAIELDGKSIMPTGAHWGTEVVGDNGETFATDGDTVVSVEIAERGPLRAIVVKKGQHQGREGHLLNYRYEIHVAAGSRGARLFYTLSNSENTLGEHLRRVTLRLPWNSRRHTTHVQRPAKSEQIEALTDTRIEAYQHRHDTASVQLADSEAQTRTSAQLLGWASAQGDASLHVGLRYCWQMYPKRLLLDKGVHLDLLPEPMDDGDIPPEAKGPYEVEGRTIGGVGYPQANGKPGRFRLAIGESITHELWIELSNDANAASADRFRAALCPLRAWPDAAYVASTKVFAEFHPADAVTFPDYERKVDSCYRGFMSKRERRKQYGMENFGDDTFEWGYGPSYTFWSNQEDDRTHGMLMQYVRSGDPRWWELGEQAARHYRDVDCVLAWPGRPDQAGGPRHHSSRHFVSKGWVADHTHSGCSTGHSWIEGLIDYWLLTGDLLAGEAAVRMGDWYVHRVKTNRFGGGGQERGLGWTLTALTSIYRATWDERYLEAAGLVQDWIDRWQDPIRGVISVPISEQPSYEGGTTFMHGIVAHGIARYADVTGDPQAQRSLAGIANWIVTEPMGPPGRFWYKQSPRCKRGYGYNGKAMTAMSYLYRMTGDPYMGYITNEIFTHVGAGIRSMPFLTPTVAHVARLRKPIWLQVPTRSLRVAPAQPGELVVELRNVTAEPLEAEIGVQSTHPDLSASPGRRVMKLAPRQSSRLKLNVSTNSKDASGSLAIRVRAGGVEKCETVHVQAIAKLLRIERTAKQGVLEKPVVVQDDFATTPRPPDFPGKPRPTDGKTGGHITWELQVPAPGRYAVMAEVYWLDDKGNSWYESIGGADERVFGNDPNYLRWHWVRGGTYNLAAGEHRVRFRTREDGARVRRVVLTNDVGE